MLRVYTYKNCDTCRKAVQFLDARGIVFEQIPIRETPPSPAELKRMLGFVGGDLRQLFNTSGADYKALNMKARLPGLTDKEAFVLLSTNGNLVKRPFALTDRFGLVGFKPDQWAAAFAS